MAGGLTENLVAQRLARTGAVAGQPVPIDVDQHRIGLTRALKLLREFRGLALDLLERGLDAVEVVPGRLGDRVELELVGLRNRLQIGRASGRERVGQYV